MKFKKELIYTLTGAAIALTSVALITDYIVQKKKSNSSRAGKLIAGLLGIGLGALIAYIPEHQAKKKLPVEQLFTEDEERLVNRNISEVLSRGAEHTPKRVVPSTIELDEETTIEDFIFDDKK